MFSKWTIDMSDIDEISTSRPNDVKGAATLAKQGSITFIGNLMNRVLRFGFILVVTRLVPSSTYGIFTLSLSIITIAQGILSLNLNRSLDYYIPDFLSMGQPEQAKAVLLKVIAISVGASLVGSYLLFVLRFNISSAFNAPQLTQSLTLFVWAIPLLTLNKIFFDLFKGIKNLRFRTYVRDFTDPVVRLSMVVILVLFGGGLAGIIGAHLLGLAISGLVGIVIVYRKVDWITTAPIGDISTQSLVSYSLPLMFAGAIYMLIGQIDYFFIGFYQDAAAVGQYRVGFFLAVNLLIVLQSLTPVFKPMVVEAKGNDDLLKSRYGTATRWSIILTIPIAISFLAAPDTYISLFFTSKYTVASTAFVILTIGYLLNAAFGPDGMLLEGLGHTRLTLLNSVVFVLVNGVLDFLLIPRLGIRGAAVATATAMTVTGVISLAQIYLLQQIQPYTINTLKTMLAAVPSSIIAFSLGELLRTRLIVAILIPLVTVVGYLMSLRAIGAFDEADVELANRVDKRLGHRLIGFIVDT